MSAPVDPAAFRVPNPIIERRERRPVAMSGHAALADGVTTTDVHVIDLSYDGCGIETSACLKAGDRIKLWVRERGAIDAEVRWSSAGKAGLVFKPEPAPAPAKPHWPRRNSRVALSAEVSVRRMGRSKYRVRVLDLSPDGCKVEMAERPQVKEHVFVKLHGLELLEARVCWTEGHQAGLRFEKPMHRAVFDLLIQQLQQ